MGMMQAMQLDAGGTALRVVMRPLVDPKGHNVLIRCTPAACAERIFMWSTATFMGRFRSYPGTRWLAVSSPVARMSRISASAHGLAFHGSGERAGSAPTAVRAVRIFAK